eukprot:2610947-Pyramimonas_sp.AAC.1
MGRAPPAAPSSLLGLWTWAIMTNRAAFCILDAACRWMNGFCEEDAMRRQKLDIQVLSELQALSALHVFMEADLEAPWLERVYMADASEEGFAAVVTKADVEEIRTELSRGSLQSWTIQAARAHTEVEQEVEAEGDEDDAP